MVNIRIVMKIGQSMVESTLRWSSRISNCITVSSHDSVYCDNIVIITSHYKLLKWHFSEILP